MFKLVIVAPLTGLTYASVASTLMPPKLNGDTSLSAFDLVIVEFRIEVV